LNHLSKIACNRMSNTVSAPAGRLSGWAAETTSLYALDGGRKYLNRAERQRALAAMEDLRPEQALFALTLAWTGARVTEVLKLTPASFQVECNIVSLQTLKRRKLSVREVPIPPFLTAELNAHYGVSRAQRTPGTAHQRLWPWSRVTAWRIIKGVMEQTGIAGHRACPRGLRHAFGVGVLQSGIPLNLLKRWLGHARISSTEIYAAACGPEEFAFAAQFWRSSDDNAPGRPNALFSPNADQGP
jgi:integrase/recombinase XerD